MIHLSDLPSVNAALNATSAVCLMAGWAAIRRRRIPVHRAFMIAAFSASTLFLFSYIVYHASAGVTRFARPGWVRSLYLGILLTHTALAAAVPPLAVLTLVRAVRGRFEAHRAIARWTLPIWMYVSVTGVVVYWMLYHF